MTFRQAYLCEEVNGLWRSEGYEVWRWLEGYIYVSLVRQEDVLFCHFSADRASVRLLKQAIDEFCATVFDLMPWCKAVMACIKRDSVTKLVKRCGFTHVIDHNYLKVYARYR